MDGSELLHPRFEGFQLICITCHLDVYLSHQEFVLDDRLDVDGVLLHGIGDVCKEFFHLPLGEGEDVLFCRSHVYLTDRKVLVLGKYTILSMILRA